MILSDENQKMMQDQYMKLVQGYGVGPNTATELWDEIVTYYSQEQRYYHNFKHLKDLSLELASVQHKIQHWDVILFTLYYHDIIYNTSNNDNEEKSAELAAQRMQEIGVDRCDIERCRQQILATKGHAAQADSDTNYFTDADLSILGKSPTEYASYCSNIRKEYSNYPYSLYQQGRKKVVQHFLSMGKIFKTKVFYDKYEEQAKQNLSHELKSL